MEENSKIPGWLQPKKRLSELAITDQSVDPYDETTPKIPSHLDISNKIFLDQIERDKKKHRALIELLMANPILYESIQRHAYENVPERYLEQICSIEYSPTWLKSDTKKIFFDIESYHLPKDPEIQLLYPTSSTDYLSRQRLGVCVSIDDKGEVKLWDEQNVDEFKKHLFEYDEAITFNGLRFDNHLLAGYCPDRSELQKLANRSFDLLYFLEALEGQRRSLDFLSKKYLGRGKLDRGASSKQVPKTLREGDPTQVSWVWKYCYWDVLLLKDLYEAAIISPEKKAKLFECIVKDLDQRIETEALTIVRSGTSNRIRTLTGSSEASDQFAEITNSVRNYLLAHPEASKNNISNALKNTKSQSMGYFIEKRSDIFKTQILINMQKILQNVLVDLRAEEKVYQLPLGGIVEMNFDWNFLATQICNLVTSQSNYIRMMQCIDDMNFIPTDTFANTDLAEREYRKVKKGNYDFILINGIEGQTYCLVDQLKKGFPGLSTEENDATKPVILTTNITQAAEQEVKEKGLSDRVQILTVLDANQLSARSLLRTYQNNPEENIFDEFLSLELKTKLPTLIQQSRLTLAKLKRQELEEKLEKFSNLIIPEELKDKAKWLIELNNEKKKIIRTLICFDYVEGKISKDQLTELTKEESDISEDEI